MNWDRLDFLRFIERGSVSGFHRFVSLIHLMEVGDWEYVRVATDRGTYHLQGNE